MAKKERKRKLNNADSNGCEESPSKQQKMNQDNPQQKKFKIDSDKSSKKQINGKKTSDKKEKLVKKLKKIIDANVDLLPDKSNVDKVLLKKPKEEKNTSVEESSDNKKKQLNFNTGKTLLQSKKKKKVCKKKLILKCNFKNLQYKFFLH